MTQETGFTPESLRLLGAALALQQHTRTAANLIPIPNTGRFIAIGTPAEVARLLETAPASADNPSTVGGDNERELFEGWAQGRVTSLIQGKFGTGYVYADAARAWDAWKARAAFAAPVAQSTAGAAKGGITDAYQFLCNVVADAAPMLRRNYCGKTADLLEMAVRDLAAPAAQAPTPTAAEVKATCMIQPMPVERDKDGWWSHPGIPNFDEDHKSFSAWVKAVGLEVKYKCLESYPEHPLYDAWFERGECDASSWEPEAPAGDGWFTFSIHDTEDGPVWVWARRALRTASKEGGAA